MKYKIILIFCVLSLVCIFISISCKKNNENSESLFSDNILFNDINPDVILTSTDFYSADSFHFCSKTPTPTDSIALYYIDINNDSIDDFELTVQRWMYIGQGSSFSLQPCLRYKNYRTSISPLNSANKICRNRIDLSPNEFNKGEIISSDSLWSEFACTLYTNSVENQFAYSPKQQEYYLGIRINNKEEDYYGWILINVAEDYLIVKETSINLSENKKIIAGQRL